MFGRRGSLKDDDAGGVDDGEGLLDLLLRAEDGGPAQFVQVQDRFEAPRRVVPRNGQAPLGTETFISAQGVQDNPQQIFISDGC